MATVTWRNVVAVLVATVLGLGALVVVFRSDGIPGIDALASRATRWFVHQPTGRVVLADGYGGRALASLDADAQGAEIRVVEGGPGAYVINDTSGEVRSIDTAELRLGPARGLVTLGSGRSAAGVGSSGLVVVDRAENNASLLPVGGEAVGFDVDVGDTAVIAPDGVIWSMVDGALMRNTAAGSTTVISGIGASAALSLVGNQPLLLDRENRRARLGDGNWNPLSTSASPSEIIVQQPGPANGCGWVGSGDELWCVSAGGIDESVVIAGLDIGGSDFLAIAGDAAALVRRGPTEIVRFDWRTGIVLPGLRASINGGAVPDVIATVDLVWVDDVAGDFVWAINPWAISAINKNDGATLVLGEDGRIIDDGGGAGGAGVGAGDGGGSEPEERLPDNNGIDDPPVAVDDPVRARTGRTVPVPVTANDYDPDGEAIAVVAVGRAGHGSVEIGTASTVVYTPEPGYVGLDEFTYTIADGDGTEASAQVTIDLIALDATNQPPVGTPDEAETGPGVPVVIDVLLNDVDPDRDPIQIGSFTVPDGVGAVTETVGPSGLAGLRFQPLDGFEGSAVFAYRPVDSFGALGDDVDVRVQVAREGDDNRPPVVRPDSVRLRRGVITLLPVLVNDEDPDGDRLELSVVSPLPEGLRVDVRGEQLAITARAGSAESIPFEYAVDDGNGHVVKGAVLVDVIDDFEPNRPPVAVADADAAVVGRTIQIDVLANDTDPDGDPLVVVDVSQPADGRGQAVVLAPDRIQFTPAALDDETDAIARFTYTVDDGNRHQVVGDVTVTVLPEPLPEPPYAQDDSTFTFVDEPVTIDVLRNDGDPSGERPTLVGRPGCPSGGRAVITADGQVRYVPPLGQSGAFRCTYEVTNSVGLRATASIIVSVREPLVTNEPPNTVLDTMFVEVGATDRIDVTDNDEDPDGDDDELEVVSSTAPSLGTATRDGNVITFTAGSETGVTTISYQVADAEGAVSSGQVSIRITDPTNDPPIAQDDRATVVSPFGTTINVLKNDSDPNEPASGLTVDSVTRLSGRATLSLDGSVVSVVPDPDYIGDVIATYTVRDSGGLTDTARITVVVLEPENRPPQAVDDVNDVNNGGSVATPVLFNDSDPDGDDLSLSIVAGPDPALGSANLSGNSIVFTAQPGAAGTAVITYSISDGEFTSEAVVRITVRPCSESTPVAQDGFLFTGYQQPIAVNLAAFTANGTITVLKAPPGYSAGVYTPPAGENGNVAIDYAVENSCRQRATGQIVIDVNRGPVAQPVTIPMGRGETREFPVSSLAGDDEALSITGSPGAPGWVVTEPGRVVLAPQLAEATGTYSWSTNVVDPGGLTASVAFTVTIVNAAPFANGDTADVSGGPASFDLLANDVDPDGDDARLRLQSIPTTVTFENGGVGTVTVVGAEQRVVAIDPLTGLGQATFTYTIVDPDGAVSGPATVVVTAGPVNSAPTAADQTVAVPTGAPTDVVLAASDPDGDPLTVIELVDPAGIVTGVNGITVSIIVEADGTFTFTYRVSDGVATSAVVTVTVTATTTTTTTLPPPTTVPPTTVPPTTAPPTTVPPTTAPPTTAPPTTVPPTITTSPPPPDQDQ